MIYIKSTTPPTTGTERIVRISPDGAQGARLAVALKDNSQEEKLRQILKENKSRQTILDALLAEGLSYLDASSI